MVIDVTKTKFLGEILALVSPCLTSKFTNMRLTCFFVVGSLILIYVYIYVCVCVCVCIAWPVLSHLSAGRFL